MTVHTKYERSEVYPQKQSRHKTRYLCDNHSKENGTVPHDKMRWKYVAVYTT